MKRISASILLVSGLLFIIGYFVSCSGKNKKNNSIKSSTEKKDTIIRKPPGSFSDTITINFPSAVFYNPDSLQLEKIKEVTLKNQYESEVHNCFYLMRNARVVLKKYWPKIRIIETSVNRYLLFVKADKNKICVDLNSKGDMCGIFLFDGKKEPELADMMNIDTVLGFYFGK
jgi:hypothetical protein